MEIWLDTADLELIEKAKQMGILYGVTTNPSILAKSKQRAEDLLQKILQIQKGPVTAQVTAEKAPEMIRQGEKLFQFSNRIIVKVPLISEGLKAISALREKSIPTMATVVFSPDQVLLAASAGATYIAPYFSSICEADIDGPAQVKEMLRILDRYRFPSKLLAASLKSAEQVRQCVEIGAHAVTLKKEVFLELIQNHGEAIKRIDRFAQDWESAEKSVLFEAPNT